LGNNYNCAYRVQNIILNDGFREKGKDGGISRRKSVLAEWLTRGVRSPKRPKSIHISTKTLFMSMKKMFLKSPLTIAQEGVFGSANIFSI